MQPQIANTDASLQPCPINRDWVVAGQPVARNTVLFRSKDRTATTIVWDCSAGSFDWFYDCDETIHVLDGQATLTFGGATQTIRAGDLVFFPAGTQARWDVERHIRKLAFFRRTVPAPLSLALRGFGRVRALFAVGRSGRGAIAGI